MDKIIDSPSESCQIINEYIKMRNIEKLFISLSSAQKNIVYALVIDLLPKKLIENSGYFFGKLLEREQITYSKLASYIYGYMECMDEIPKTKNNKGEMAEKELEYVKSCLQNMMNAKSITEKNPYKKYICDFFSVSDSVLRYGVGKKYTIDMEKVAAIFDKQKISEEEFIECILNKVYSENSKAISDCDYYIRHSHVVFGNLVEDRFFGESVLIEEDYSLLDIDSFIEYWEKLEWRERCAVYRLMENIKKEL